MLLPLSKTNIVWIESLEKRLEALLSRPVSYPDGDAAPLLADSWGHDLSFPRVIKKPPGRAFHPKWKGACFPKRLGLFQYGLLRVPYDLATSKDVLSMIISRTPYRISLFGGGTDFPVWYHKHGGGVIAAAINKYCYISARYLPPFFEHRYRIVWSKIEHRKEIGEIEHPSVRAVLNYLGIDKGVEISHIGDLPARSGIGSSSSFTVGLLKALYGLKGRMIGKHDLAMEAIHVEQELLRENVGSQDQVSAAYGGFNHIQFHQSGEVTVTPITLPTARIRELEDHLMLFFTGVSRTSSDVQQQFLEEIEAKRRQLRILNDLTSEAIEILNGDRDIKELGLLLQEAWDAKKGFSTAVTNREVDNLHAEAVSAGAISGKITGAGGGGFLLLFVPPDRRGDVLQALHRFIHVPFRFDFSGSQIMMAHQDPDIEELNGFADVKRTLEGFSAGR